jgi:TPR repeat protein
MSYSLLDALPMPKVDLLKLSEAWHKGARMHHCKFLLATIVLATIGTPGMSNAASPSNDPVLETLMRSCEAGVLDDCNRVGIHFITQRLARGDDKAGIKHDFTEAARYFEKACNGGSALGCYQEGFVVETGELGDSTKVAELYKKACDGSYAMGCMFLAVDYENGPRGLPRDSAKAAGLYRKAAGLFQVECDRGEEASCASAVAARADAAKHR